MSERARRRGLSRDTGWIVGVRRTLPLDHGTMWALLTSPEGLRCWLGEAPGLTVSKGAAYELPDGTSGAFSVVEPGSHVRLTWQPPGWPRPAITQVRAMASGDNTIVAFHQEHLPNQAARVARRAFFTGALEELRQLCLGRQARQTQDGA